MIEDGNNPFKDMPTKEYLKEQEEDITSGDTDLKEVVESLNPKKSRSILVNSRSYSINAV